MSTYRVVVEVKCSNYHECFPPLSSEIGSEDILHLLGTHLNYKVCVLHR